MSDWLHEEPPVCGVGRLRAGLKRHAYSRHRHDTYTVARTDSGVQEFDYRGTVFRSLPGQVVVLHPDEPHDGRSGTRDGFSYRTLYLDPMYVLDAVRALSPRAATLPFVATPVLPDTRLARLLAAAFDGPLEPLRAQELVEATTVALLHAARPFPVRSRRRVAGEAALRRAREFLDANFRRVVAMDELERACGETRYTLGAQFRSSYGTTPYRYLLMRRLDHVRARLGTERSLAALAHDAGFADQPHMTRMFKAAFGMTPRAYAGLRRAARSA